MNANTFNELLERKLADSRTVLAGKATEYSHGGDRLSNFKRAADTLRCTPEAALLGFVTKHITALYDFVAALPDGNITLEQWAEKTGDIRNYMLLLDGLIEERLYRNHCKCPHAENGARLEEVMNCPVHGHLVPLPAAQYYMLKNGDPIQTGDEILINGRWELGIIPGILHTTFDETIHVKMRRSICK